MALESGDEADLREALRGSVEGTERAEALLDGLLVLASTSRGIRRDERVDLSVGSFAGVEVDVLPTPVRGDPALLGRLVGNLVENAVRHGSEPRRLTVRPEGGEAVVRVVNGGEPIEDEWSPGWRSRSSAARACAPPAAGSACRSCAPWPRPTAAGWSSPADHTVGWWPRSGCRCLRERDAALRILGSMNSPLLPERDDELDPSTQTRRVLEAALWECKRVVVGQDAMLERVIVALLAGGHVLLEGVPGLAKTLTVRTLADVLGGSFARIQFTPDLVPADLVGTRIWHPDRGAFETELGPVFANLLLADEINRAPAKVQSALLEVMQERQVTIGGETHKVPHPFLVLATQNPIESEGTYQLPEAQVDRFLFKLVVGYPELEDEVMVARGLAGERTQAREVLELERSAALPRGGGGRAGGPRGRDFAVRLVDATRNPASTGWRTSRG